MIKKALIFLSFVIVANGYAQNNYEKGYYIDNLGNKIEGYIKNYDWNNNPDSFKFKKSKESEVITKRIFNVKEFYVGNSIFIRKEVQIDRSSNVLKEFSLTRKPEFKKETLFLKVLINGSSANLYSFTDGNLKRYFYKLANSEEIIQLVYKKYRARNGALGINNLYKKQLKDLLPCSSIDKVPSYVKKDLKKYFVSYNNCTSNDINLIDYVSKETKGKYVLRAKAGVNYTKVIVTPAASSFGSISSVSDSKISPRFGVELEYLLPLNNNSWSFFIEPTYVSFNGVSEGRNNGFIASSDYDVDYKSIEIPIGFRYYFSIKNSVNLFLNGGFALDLPMDSTVGNREVKSKINFFGGLGCVIKEKHTLEIRYNGNRGLLRELDANYSGLSLNIGYKLF